MKRNRGGRKKRRVDRYAGEGVMEIPTDDIEFDKISGAWVLMC